MAIEIKAPAFPESVADGEVAAWHKQEGEAVSRDELIVEIETDKVVMEVVAPEDGVITRIHAQEGETIQSEQLLATLEPGAAGAAPARAEPEKTAAVAGSGEAGAEKLGPAARKLVEEHKLDPGVIAGSGKGGRITKEDVLKHLESGEQPAAAEDSAAGPFPMPYSGLGRRSLAQYCEKYDLALDDLVALLPDGADPDPERKFRELAEELGTDPKGVIDFLNERARAP